MLVRQRLVSQGLGLYMNINRPSQMNPNRPAQVQLAPQAVVNQG
jgi:hypothetical protein